MLVFEPNKKVKWVFKLLFLLDWAEVVMRAELWIISYRTISEVPSLMEYF